VQQDDAQSRSGAGRRTLSVREVADLLRVSGARVRQLLDDAGNCLDGPPSGGKGHVRFIWSDTLQRYLATRSHDPTGHGSPIAEVADPASPSSAEGAIASVLGRLDGVFIALEEVRGSKPRLACR
jgi:hypothetical protein